MEDLLYENAIFFKEKVLPFFFCLNSNKGVMIIEPTTHSFAHLVGKQYVSTECRNIDRMPTDEFYNKVLKKEITIYDLLQEESSHVMKREHQYIIEKNVHFKEVFNSFFSNTNIRLYLKKYKNVYYQLDIDYYHSQNMEDGLNILGMTGHSMDNLFSFSTIMHVWNKGRINEFIKPKSIHFSIECVLKKDIKKYIDSRRDIIVSPRKNNDIRLKKSKSIDLKKSVKRMNSLLNKPFKVTLGRYGKNTIQLYKGKKMIESKIKIDLNKMSSIEEIVKYIHESYCSDA